MWYDNDGVIIALIIMDVLNVLLLMSMICNALILNIVSLNDMWYHYNNVNINIKHVYINIIVMILHLIKFKVYDYNNHYINKHYNV